MAQEPKDVEDYHENSKESTVADDAQLPSWEDVAVHKVHRRTSSRVRNSLATTWFVLADMRNWLHKKAQEPKDLKDYLENSEGSAVTDDAQLPSWVVKIKFAGTRLALDAGSQVASPRNEHVADQNTGPWTCSRVIWILCTKTWSVLVDMRKWLFWTYFQVKCFVASLLQRNTPTMMAVLLVNGTVNLISTCFLNTTGLSGGYATAIIILKDWLANFDFEYGDDGFLLNGIRDVMVDSYEDVKRDLLLGLDQITVLGLCINETQQQLAPGKPPLSACILTIIGAVTYIPASIALLGNVRKGNVWKGNVRKNKSFTSSKPVTVPGCPAYGFLDYAIRKNLLSLVRRQTLAAFAANFTAFVLVCQALNKAHSCEMILLASVLVRFAAQMSKDVVQGENLNTAREALGMSATVAYVIASSVPVDQDYVNNCGGRANCTSCTVGWLISIEGGATMYNISDNTNNASSKTSNSRHCDIAVPMSNGQYVMFVLWAIILAIPVLASVSAFVKYATRNGLELLEELDMIGAVSMSTSFSAPAKNVLKELKVEIPEDLLLESPEFNARVASKRDYVCLSTALHAGILTGMVIERRALIKAFKVRLDHCSEDDLASFVKCAGIHGEQYQKSANLFAEAISSLKLTTGTDLIGTDIAERERLELQNDLYTINVSRNRSFDPAGLDEIQTQTEPAVREAS